MVELPPVYRFQLLLQVGYLPAMLLDLRGQGKFGVWLLA